MTECTGKGSLDDVKKETFSSTKLLTGVTVADKLVLVNPIYEITICSLILMLFSGVCLRDIRRELFCRIKNSLVNHWPRYRLSQDQN